MSAIFFPSSSMVTAKECRTYRPAMRFFCSCRVTILAIWALRAASSFSSAEIFCSASSLASAVVFSCGSSWDKFGKEICLLGGFSKKGSSSWRVGLNLTSVLQGQHTGIVRGFDSTIITSRGSEHDMQELHSVETSGWHRDAWDVYNPLSDSPTWVLPPLFPIPPSFWTTWETAGDGSVTYLGDPDGSMGCWLQPGPALPLPSISGMKQHLKGFLPSFSSLLPPLITLPFK